MRCTLVVDTSQRSAISPNVRFVVLFNRFIVHLVSREIRCFDDMLIIIFNSTIRSSIYLASIEKLYRTARTFIRSNVLKISLL